MSEKQLSSLQLRVLSAGVLAPIAIGALIMGGVYFAVFMGLAAMAMCYEWCHNSISSQKTLFTLITMAVVLVAIYLSYNSNIFQSVMALFCGGIITAIGASFLKQSKDLIWALVGPIVTGLPVISLVALREIPDIGFAVTTSLFLVIWATDIGAYFSGRTIGGPKIAPVISPNKTWAGLIGGMVAAMIVAYFAAYFLISEGSATFGVVILGAACAILAQAGDFTESAWKRNFDIKDASALIPGHGGVLDRLDGVLFVAPAILVLMQFVDGK